MNRDTTLGFILIALILIGYSIWMTPSKEEMAERQRKADSIAVVRQQNKILDSLQHALEAAQAPVQAVEIQPATSDSIEPLTDLYGAFAISATGEDNDIILENKVFRITLASKGGAIRKVEHTQYQTWDSLPLIVFEPSTADFDLNFFSRNRIINTHSLYFQPYIDGKPFQGERLISETDNLSLSMRAYADGEDSVERYIEYEYILRPDEYMLDFLIRFKGMEGIISSNTTFVNLDWKLDLLQQERTVDRFSTPTIYYKHFQDDVDNLSERKNDEKSVKTRVKWVSFKQRFFSATLIAGEAFDNAFMRHYEKEIKPNPRYLKTMEASVELPLQGSSDQQIALSFYFGPNSFPDLRDYKLDLERQIPLGWGFFLMAWINIYVVIPVFTFLGSYGWNYGIVILILTILIKAVLFPIAYKTYMSSAKMRVLKPEIDEISAKYPKQEDAMKKQQAIMSLYKRAGVNPMSGCIPMLLQMPILIAMFRFFPSSIELRQQSFLWATDLSSFDSILDLPFTIPFYGSHVSLFTLLMTISTIIYTYLNNQMMGQQTGQMPGMKTMMYFMPVMFLGIFNNYASGLSYYYMLTNLITFGQMFIFRQLINEDKLRARIEANKKKPVKKSAFQKRMEDAAKQRGVKM
ncbi:MAG: membrane protein insertase YidC [Bacteroidales bacterium]|jgi:YidC/Oxa1 family membrane protein insertase|nr:membrane protein insertase YidC [Bacteroidales bacterium]